MKIVSIDTARRDNFKVTFDTPVEVVDAADYIAEIYKKASNNPAVKVQRPADCVRKNDGRYAIVDGTRRNALFEMGPLTKEPAKNEYYVYQYHADENERELLIQSLEKVCLG